MSIRFDPSAYDALSGEMNGCLGKACPKSCCLEKRVAGGPETDYKYVSYRTTLVDEAEYRHQMALEQADPKLEGLGVKIGPTNTANGIRYLVNGCLDESAGCKLGEIGRKPLLCRVYPLGFGAKDEDIDWQCPVAADIRKQGGEQLKEKLITVDRIIGYSRARAEKIAERQQQDQILARHLGYKLPTKKYT